jgi:hypothetical protein
VGTNNGSGMNRRRMSSRGHDQIEPASRGATMLMISASAAS